MLASSGETYSFGPVLGPAPARILLSVFVVSPSTGATASSSLDSPPPILMKTTQSIIKRVPIQSLSDNFCFFQKKNIMIVKTQVEEKMEEMIPGLIPLFSANMNE